MSEKLQVYKCEICGLIIEVLDDGQDPVCCEEEMILQKENTVDAAKEKHVPVIEKIDGGYKVSVGSVAHPMEEKHYIEWIELLTCCKSYRQFLKPGDAPEATFLVDSDDVSARAYCNLHGLWRNQ